MICPYHLNHTNSTVNCLCGTEHDKYKGDAVLHIGKYCNNKYTQCSIYQDLRRKLQNLEEVQI